MLIPGRAAFSIRFPPESLFTSRRNLYSHHSGTIIHIARNTHQSTLVDNTLVRERLLALISGFFSIVAIVLVAVGLYGVLS